MRNHHAAVGLMLLWAAAGCRHPGELPAQPTPAHLAAAPAPPPAARNDGKRVLETYAATPYTYELFIERRPRDPQRQDADEVEDPYGVRLLKGGRTLDELLLPDSSCGQASVHPVAVVRGGDPESKAWTTDAEHCEAGIAARTVNLSVQVTGLLITQAKGYEYRYSSHYLYIAEADHLRPVWNYDESFGSEERTNVSVLNGTVAFINVLRMSDGVSAKASAQRLRYNPSTVGVSATSLPDAESPLFVVVAGNFSKAKDALALQSECRGELDVLKSSFFPSLRLPPYFYARIFARQADAEKALADLAACPELPQPRVVTDAQGSRSLNVQ